MPGDHPLTQAVVVHAVERTASQHSGRPWRVEGFVDLNERASHPCGIFHGETFSVFAKLDAGVTSEQFEAELRGLRLLGRQPGVTTPTPVGERPVITEAGSLLLLEALPEIPAQERSAEQWRSLGRVLGALHQVRGETFGLGEFDGFFGPLRQDNRAVASNRWADFYAERRVLPCLRAAVDSGNLPRELAHQVERVVERLGELCGPEPVPTLLHGDAQQNNFLTTATEAVMLDSAPFFGHPEVDLALVDYFAPVPKDFFDGYAEKAFIEEDFIQRRELWRLFAYLAVVAVDGANPFGRSFLAKIDEATRGGKTGSQTATESSL